jgi:hypothetical protein
MPRAPSCGPDAPHGGPSRRRGAGASRTCLQSCRIRSHSKSDAPASLGLAPGRARRRSGRARSPTIRARRHPRPSWSRGRTPPADWPLPRDLGPPRRVPRPRRTRRSPRRRRHRERALERDVARGQPPARRGIARPVQRYVDAAVGCRLVAPRSGASAYLSAKRVRLRRSPSRAALSNPAGRRGGVRAPSVRQPPPRLPAGSSAPRGTSTLRPLAAPQEQTSVRSIGPRVPLPPALAGVD